MHRAIVLLSVLGLGACAGLKVPEGMAEASARSHCQFAAISFEAVRASFDRRVELRVDIVLNLAHSVDVFVVGTGDWARPGYHWLVRIDPETCAVLGVQEGQ